MTESEEMKARLKEITKLPDRAAYCWLKVFADKAVKTTTTLVPLPHVFAGCSQKELAEFMKSERVGQGLTKDEIKKVVRERQQYLRKLVQPAARQTMGKNQKTGKKSKDTLVKALEETYTKKRGKK
jgi:hypothetical protein